MKKANGQFGIYRLPSEFVSVMPCRPKEIDPEKIPTLFHDLAKARVLARLVVLAQMADQDSWTGAIRLQVVGRDPKDPRLPVLRTLISQGDVVVFGRGWFRKKVVAVSPNMARYLAEHAKAELVKCPKCGQDRRRLSMEELPYCPKCISFKPIF